MKRFPLFLLLAYLLLFALLAVNPYERSAWWAEILLRRRIVLSRVVLYLFPICFILTVARVYELFDWRYALSADPAAGIAVLGSQGDVWDAQKDMLADGLGAVAAIILFAGRNRREISALPSPREVVAP